MSHLGRDLRFALRMMWKTPAVTAVAVLALALGIGANTALFSAVSAVLLRPPPFPQPDQLTLVFETQPYVSDSPVSTPDFLDWRAQAHSFTDLAALTFWDFNLAGDGDPERLLGFRVSPSFLRVLEVSPALGRGFVPEEEQPGRDQVALISHELWQRRFGSDARIVGRTITLNDKPTTVIGVLPEGFGLEPFPGMRVDVWAPLPIDPPKGAGERSNHWLYVLGRLKPGIERKEADAEMQALAGRLATAYPDSNRNVGAKVVRLQDHLVQFSRPQLLVLLGATALVLLIACANIANLLLARASARQTEIAIRLALGASRRRLLQQLLTESVLLALVGGGLGALLALWGTDLLAAGFAQSVLSFMHIRVDLPVLAFSLALSVATGILAGLVPAWQAIRPDLQDQLKQTRGVVAPHRLRLRNALVVAEVALSLALVAGAGLMVRSFVQLGRVRLGFDAHNVVTMRLSLPESRYRSDESVATFERQLLERVRSLPGVDAAALSNSLPLTWTDINGDFEIQGHAPWPDGKSPLTQFITASPDYFRALGIRLAAGRAFDEHDSEKSAPVAIINRTMATRFFPGENPLGRRIKIGWSGDAWREIVGVVDDTKRGGFIGGEARAETYFPCLQRPTNWLALVVRGKADAAPLVGPIKEQLRAIDPGQPVYDVMAMDRLVATSLSDSRFQTVLFTLFGAMALLLASIGVYGVMSYGVGQRMHELGIRMALGASTRQVKRMVVAQGLRMAAVGIALGIGLGLAAGRAMSTLLYGVTASDLPTFLIATALLLSTALMACWIPARRATRVDPMRALRAE